MIDLCIWPGSSEMNCVCNEYCTAASVIKVHDCKSGCSHFLDFVQLLFLVLPFMNKSPFLAWCSPHALGTNFM